MNNIDLDRRLAIGFIFGLAGLALEIVGSLAGLPVSEPVVYALSGLVIATFTAQAFTVGPKATGKAGPEVDQAEQVEE